MGCAAPATPCPSAGVWGLGALPAGRLRRFAAEKRGNVTPRLGLEGWQQEPSPHLQELKELNQKILSPVLGLCPLLPRGTSERASPGPGLSPVPVREQKRPRGTRGWRRWLGVTPQDCLVWVCSLANVETSTTRLSRGGETETLGPLLSSSLANSPLIFPPPASSSLEIWRKKRENSSFLQGLSLISPACAQHCGQDSPQLVQRQCWVAKWGSGRNPSAPSAALEKIWQAGPSNEMLVWFSQ